MNLHEVTHCLYCGSWEISVIENSFKCGDCGRQVFDNQAAAVGVVLRLPDGRILLSERGRDPFKGLHDFPGGFVDRDENLEDAAVRELREELGVEIDPARLRYVCSGHVQYVFSETVTYVTDVHFVVDISEAEFAQMRAMDDVAQIVPMQPAEVTREMMAWDTGWEVVERVRVLTV